MRGSWARTAVDHQPCALVERKAADAGAEGGQRKRLGAQLVRDSKHAPRRALDELGVRPQVLRHHRAVDHPPRGQPARAGRDRIADGNRAFRDRLALDLLTACALQRACDAGAHPQMIVRSVRDRVDIERGDITVDDFELHPPRVLNSCIPYSRGAHR